MWLFTASSVLGQNAHTMPAHPAHAPGPRSITRAEGRQILATISAVDTDSQEEADCSHLVHDLYEQAGFPYDYASSRDLYMGNMNFTRVRVPQPGDLVVWRGHVGIVIDPKERSFFSSVRSGPDTQFYDSPYWRSRGTPRFFRYMTEKPLRAGRTLEAARRRDQQPLPAAIRTAENRPPVKPAKPAPDSLGRSSADAPAMPPVTPREMPLHISGKNPEPDEIAAAFTDWAEESAEFLRAGNLGNPGKSIIVFRQAQVAGVQIKGKSGTAFLRVESLAALSAPQPGSQPRWKEVTLDLRKTKNGWLMTTSGEALYMPREAALQILSARLAALTRQSGASPDQEREQTQIIRFLNLLVLEDSSSASVQNNPLSDNH